jgi:hypothetical protein
MLAVKFNIDAADRQIEQIALAIKAGVRVAAQAGAQVYYDEMKMRAGAIKESGTLQASIYQKYVREMSTDGVRAQYHISWNKGKGRATPVAFHGQLIEYGWVQRYASYMDTKGNWHTAVKPENYGKTAPWIGAGKNGRNKRPTQKQTDDWFVARKGGPIQHAPRSFLRATYEAKKTDAVKAAEIAMQDHILKHFV